MCMCVCGWGGGAGAGGYACGIKREVRKRRESHPGESYHFFSSSGPGRGPFAVSYCKNLRKESANSP